ncbi:MAG: hypothetical protein LBK06_02955 [Planctomycetaceae bacterium]|jgi:hypothetical protein|nr:hypothetical protein [Planctomycetaceae bacterium]
MRTILTERRDKKLCKPSIVVPKGAPAWFTEFAESVKDSFDTLNGSFETLNGKVDTLDGKVDTLDRKVATLSASVIDLEEGQKVFSDRMTAVESSVKSLSQQMGKLSNRVGEFTELWVVDDVKHLFEQQGMSKIAVKQQKVFTNPIGGKIIEVDILLESDGRYVAIEVKLGITERKKPKLQTRMELIRKSLAKEDSNFKSVEGGIVSMFFPTDIARKLSQAGFHVIRAKGVGLAVENEETFEPRLFCK